MEFPTVITKFVKDLITVANGTDYDVGRVLWILSVLIFLGLAIWAVVKNHQPLDFANFGIGAGGVLGGGGAALGFKRNTEPQ
jgi:hypothetical protein